MNIAQTAINAMYSNILCGDPTTGFTNPPQGTQTRYLHLFRDNTGYMDNYIASNTTNPLSSIAMSGKEISSYDYTKLDITAKITPFSNAYIANYSTIAFPTALSDWGQITHMGISALKYDGTTITPFVHSILWITRLAADEYIYAGDTLFFKSQAIKLNFR